jgi:lactoylglutathione lyase
LTDLQPPPIIQANDNEPEGREMKFCWCTIHVSDMEESLKFYQEIVGLKLERRFPAGPGMEIAFLGDGETKVELMTNEKIKKPDIGADISIGFETASLDKTMALVQEKGMKVTGPFQPNPNVKFFYVQDPNGLKVQFVENM